MKQKEFITWLPVSVAKFKFGPISLIRNTIYNYSGKDYVDFFHLSIQYVGGISFHFPGWVGNLLTRLKIKKDRTLSKEILITELEASSKILSQEIEKLKTSDI